MSLLWGAQDLGGLSWSEQAAFRLQHVIGWCLLLAAICVVVRPCASVLVPLVLVQSSIAATIVHMNWGYQVVWSWPLAAWLVAFASQAARIAAPLALLILDPWRSTGTLPVRRRFVGVSVLRGAIALTFAAHGVKALFQIPPFEVTL